MKFFSTTLAVLAAAVTMAFSSCSSVNGLTPEKLNGEWNVTLLEGEPITPAENTPYIGFNFSENQLYGFTGCNRIMGGADLSAIIKGKADFTKVGTTMMACPDDKYERKFLSALSRVKKAVAEKSVIKLVDADGNTVMELTGKNDKAQ